jgi:hypothetical protein
MCESLDFNLQLGIEKTGEVLLSALSDEGDLLQALP